MLNTRRNTALAALGYAVLVVYGSLYPFSGWMASRDPFAFLLRGWNGTQVSVGDLATNIFAYAPFGFLFYRSLVPKAQRAVAAVIAIGAAFALSLSMEFLQAFLPTRVQSIVDLLTNTAGGALGVMAARLQGTKGSIATALRRARSQWLMPGRMTDVAVFALAAWGLSRLMPLVPSLDVGKFRAALAPFAHVAADPHLFNGWRLLAEALSWAGLALIARSVVRPEKPGFAAFAVFAAAILLLQIPIVGRHLRPEVLAGCGIGLLLAISLGKASARARSNFAFVLIFAGFCVAESIASQGGALYTFNWIPLRRNLGNTLVGIESLLQSMGLAAALAWSARSGAGPRTMRGVGWGAGILTGLGAFALELNQVRLHGRVGDISTPLLMAVTFGLAWRASSRHGVAAAPDETASMAGPEPAPRAPSRNVQGDAFAGSLAFYAVALALLTLAIWFVTKLPAVNYNVRQLLYAGHPIRSAVLLSVALFLTLALPAWLVAWICRRRLSPPLLPLALLVNAFLTWTAVVNAVPSRNLHDIVGAPILDWPWQIETCLRFLALHSAVTLLVTGGVVFALPLFQARRAHLALGWVLLSLVLGPLLHWAIVTEAATDNLTELMRNGGSATASAFLSLGAVLSFLSGSLVSAGIAFARRRLLAIGFALFASVGAYYLFVAGSEPFILKYGRIFSAMQFLLSPDRAHYVGPHELIVRYVIAYLALMGTLALLQYRAWAAMAAGPRHRVAPALQKQPMRSVQVP